MKTCYRCKETKPFDCFSKSTKVKSGLQGECKECRNKRQNTEEYKAKHKEYQREYYVKNRDEVRQANRAFYYKNSYGLTIEQLTALRAEQEHCCYICGMHETENYKEILYVDHDHETGEVRKLLCAHCNTGLGLFRDSPELLDKASNYLRLHGKP